MAYNFLHSDRDQPFLLPPDLRDWLPDGHLAWFVLDVVDQLDLTAFYQAHRNDGHGHPAYDPRLLLGVLLYAYGIGMCSSRQIQRRCIDDIAFRILASNQFPDHVTIARFRVRHEQALADFLVQSLRLCAAAGLVRLGMVLVIIGEGAGGLSTDLAPAVAELPEVAAVSPLGGGPVRIDGEGTLVPTFDPATIESVEHLDVRHGSLRELRPDQVAISADYAEQHGLALGDPVTVDYPDGVPVAEGEAAVQRVADRFGAPDVQTHQEFTESIAGEINMYLTVVSLLLILAIVIAVMGIANTLSLSIPSFAVPKLSLAVVLALGALAGVLVAVRPAHRQGGRPAAIL